MQLRKLIFQSSIAMQKSLCAIKRNKSISQEPLFKVIHLFVLNRCTDIYNALENPDTKSDSDEDLYASFLNILEMRASLLLLSQSLEKQIEIAFNIETAANSLSSFLHDAIRKIELQKRQAQQVWKMAGIGFLVAKEMLLPRIDRQYYPLLAGFIPFLSLGSPADLAYRDTILKLLQNRHDILAEMFVFLKELNNTRRAVLARKLVQAEIRYEMTLMQSMLPQVNEEKMIPVLNDTLHNKKNDKSLQQFILRSMQPVSSVGALTGNKALFFRKKPVVWKPSAGLQPGVVKPEP